MEVFARLFQKTAGLERAEPFLAIFSKNRVKLSFNKLNGARDIHDAPFLMDFYRFWAAKQAVENAI